MPKPNRDHLSNTSERYSLVNGVITNDWIVHDDKVVRCVAHAVREPELSQHRDVLLGAGLVLGKLVTVAGKSTYEIPLGARPLALEAESNGDGHLTHSDAELLFDVGRVAGMVARLTAGRTILGPEAEQAFAVLDYQKVGEPSVYLAPGAEQLLSGPVTDDPLAFQMQQFSHQFGEQFDSHTADFIQGYSQGIAGQ